MPLCPVHQVSMNLKTNSKTGEAFYGCPKFPHCRQTKNVGSLTGELSGTGVGAKSRRLIPGQFVVARHWGFGKLISVGRKEAEVEFFSSPEEPTEIEVFQKKLVRPGDPKHSICTYKEEDEWRLGRITSVNLPEEKVVVHPLQDDRALTQVSLDDVFIRYRKASTNSRHVLQLVKQKVIHPPRYALSRHNFVQKVLDFRSKTRGISGLSSARVMLHPHQAEIVSRVLHDPIQRYLLADEVGLGKTIEAGSIVRQFLLDHPSDRKQVEFLVPPLLANQWESELTEKFGFKSHEFVVSKQGTWKPNPSINFLVVDEAHHLAAHAFSSDEQEHQKYLWLQTACSDADRVLLLSATPLLHNEDAFLSMLHLLDPELYPLEDLEIFKERVRNRQDLAKRFFAFRENSSPLTLKINTKHFLEMFSNDEDLVADLKELLNLLDAKDGNSSDFIPLIQKIRHHIGETYKLHRRVLRTRRGSDIAKNFPVRGRVKPTVIYDESHHGALIETWMNEWVTKMMLTRERDLQAQKILLELLNNWQTAPTVFSEFIKKEIINKFTDQTSGGFCLNEEEKELLESLCNHLDRRQEDWVSHVLDNLPELEEGEKAIVFCGDTKTALLLSENLQRVGRFDSALYVDKRFNEVNVEEEVERFKTSSYCQYLICDHTAEEGRNFQYADVAVHINLPWNPNRIEQRIGRIDRFSIGQPVKSFVFVDRDSLSEQWLKLLVEGYGVFNDSIATLQQVIAGTVEELIREIFTGGIDEITHGVEGLREKLKAERQEILEIESLESIEEESRETLGMFEQLLSLEEKSEDLEEVVTRWLTSGSDNSSGIGLERLIATNPKFMWFELTDNLKMPKKSVEYFLKNYLDEEPAVFDREAACKNASGMLMRPGNDFFDAVFDLTTTEDLGQTYGFIRSSDQVTEPLFVLRFVFTVISTTREKFRVYEFENSQVDALVRKMDDFFPPMTFEILFNSDGSPLSKTVEELVKKAYGEVDGDKSIREINEIEEICNQFGLSWESLWEKSYWHAQSLAFEYQDLNRIKFEAQKKAENRFTTQIQQIRLRLTDETEERSRQVFEKELALLEKFSNVSREIIETIEPQLELVGFTYLQPSQS